MGMEALCELSLLKSPLLEGCQVIQQQLVEQNRPGLACSALAMTLHHCGSCKAGVRSWSVPEQVYPPASCPKPGVLTLPMTGNCWAKRKA